MSHGGHHGHLLREDDHERAFDPMLFRHVLRWTRPVAAWLLVGLALLVPLSAVPVVLPWIVKQAIDGPLGVQGTVPVPATGPLGLDPGSWPWPSDLVGLAVLYLALLVGESVLRYGQGLIIQGAGQRVIRRIREETYAHLLRLDMAVFDRQPVGRLVARVTSDTENINEMVTGVLVGLFRDVFVIAGTVWALFRLDSTLAWVALAAAPIIGGLTFGFRRWLRSSWRGLRVRQATLMSVMSENLSGVPVLQAFGREDAAQATFRDEADAFYRTAWNLTHVQGILRPAIDLATQLALAAVLWAGGQAVLGHGLALGTLYAFTVYLRQLFSPLGELAEKYNTTLAAFASAERLVQLQESRPTVLARGEGPSLPEAEALRAQPLRFEGVGFAYAPDGPDVLEDVTLLLAPGETVGVVGATGAGKSSLLGLVARFHDPVRGRLLVGDVPLTRWDPEAWRRNLGMVLQEPLLFRGTLGDNLRMGREDLQDEQLRAVMSDVLGEDLERRWPEALATPMGDRGGLLSTGERQLVCLARALATDPPLLVLDEATASVDSATEEAMLRQVEARRGKGMTLVVAHRLATVRDADRIVVLHAGRVVEEGTHAALLAAGGRYATMWALQAGEGQLAVAGGQEAVLGD
ncbi:MAG: ABC transporter ATP-binding protein [Candidatus Sericytochromatia bacterium]|nr:ABC transporter ATP-binding protein [Candidatus Sericytochromatia bacterium]